MFLSSLFTSISILDLRNQFCQNRFLKFYFIFQPAAIPWWNNCSSRKCQTSFYFWSWWDLGTMGSLDLSKCIAACYNWMLFSSCIVRKRKWELLLLFTVCCVHSLTETEQIVFINCVMLITMVYCSAFSCCYLKSNQVIFKSQLPWNFF